MRKILCFLFAVLFIFTAMACEKQEQETIPTEESQQETEPIATEALRETVSAEEIRRLREEYPQYFSLDTSEGILVLVFGDDKIDSWKIRLLSGNKHVLSIWESAQYDTFPGISLEDTKTILAYYNLPDDMIMLRPYDDWIISSYKLSHYMEDETYLSRVAEAFNNRYPVGEIFEATYVEEIDGFLKDVSE